MNGWWIDARMDGWLDEWINGGIDRRCRDVKIQIVCVQGRNA